LDTGGRVAYWIDKVDDRNRLKPRRSPYWKRLSKGRYVGFRRLTRSTPGTWLARAYRGAGYAQQPLGDFATLPEKERYDAAKKAAETELFTRLDTGGTPERATVKQACEGYVEDRRVKKSEAAAADVQGRYQRLVYDDPIGRMPLAKLTETHISDWRARVLAKGGTRGSYNRNATALRAALNLAYRRRRTASNHAWREELKPLDNAVRRRTLYLDRGKRRQLLEKASAEVRPFFKTLNMLPMRPGEIAALHVEHLRTQERALEIPTGKTEPRVIPLTDEAVSHFKGCAKGKLPAAWLIARADGNQWKKEAWRDEIKAAARKAKLPRATVAYTLRHSVITDLVTGGLDLFTVAKLAGTSVVMIEKHYGHLQREHARSALEKLSMA
jgi:site-specific recombinase XerD